MISVIFFFGPDGAGKTTLAKKLCKQLSNENLHVKRSWMRGTHTLASVLARLLSRFTIFKGCNNPYYGITIPRNLKRLWQLMEFFSVLPIILLRFTLPSKLGYCVIAERYTPDLITWVSLTTRDPKYQGRIEAKFLLALAFRVPIKIYATATLEELSRRSRESIDFLRKQSELYDVLSLVISPYKLDTTRKTIEESTRELSLRILSRL